MADFVDGVISFWFDELNREAWFAVDTRVDAAIRDRFGALRDRLAADRDAAFAAAETARGALAVLLALDQFSRNLYRGQAEAFAADPLARDIARRAVVRGQHLDADLPPLAGQFFILPFEHSESLADQDWCCAFCEAVGDEMFTDYAERHRAIIRRFGRFPHRNAALGRPSTAEETAFLKEPGSSF